MYVVSKLVLEVIPPFTLISMRLTLAALTLGAALAVTGWRPIPRQHLRAVIAVGVVGYGVSLGFQFVGTKLSTAANGALVTSATPAFILVLAGWLLRERLTWRKLAAVLISTAGVLAVVDPMSANLDPVLFWGNLILLAAGVTWALYSVLVRKVSRGLSVLPLSAIAFLGGLAVSFPLAIWETTTLGLGAITWNVLAGVLFLGIVCTAFAMLLWNTAFSILEAGAASLTFFAQPIVGTILGVVLLGETTSPLFLLGALLIGAGLLLASREP